MTSRTVRDVIHDQTILCLPPETTVRAAAVAMAERRVGSVMVLEKRRLVGIFTERDALTRVLAARLDPDATTLDAVATRDVLTIGPDQPLLTALHLMHDNSFRHVPVTENGVPVGMVSIRDALGTELVRLERETRAKEDLIEVIR